MRLRLLLGAVLLWTACCATAQAAPIIAGDYPDPSLTATPSGYVATATSSAWVPAFPVFRSPDLVSWTQVGAILATTPPWVTGNLWAPDLSTDPDGSLRAYWGAARRGGRPCIGLSTAPVAEGPWTYRGRVICPAGGAIDPTFFRDADGSQWLLYKAFSASGYILAQPLAADGRTAVGAAIPILGPDAPWERGLVEAPSVVRGAGGQLLLFYAGGSCCRVPCTYATGVATAPAMTGPWTKDPRNPILTDDATWRCPGHGTALDLPDGRLAYLSHATAADDPGQRRRSAVLSAFALDATGLPVAEGPPGAAGPAQAPAPGFRESFDGPLSPAWQWLVGARPDATVRAGALDLRCDGALRFVARQVAADRFTATATLDPRAIRGQAAIGLAVTSARAVRGIELRGGHVRSFTANPNRALVGASLAVPRNRRVRLIVGVAPGGYVATYVTPAGGPTTRVDAGPAAAGPAPTRVALTCHGIGGGRITSATAG